MSYSNEELVMRKVEAYHQISEAGASMWDLAKSTGLRPHKLVDILGLLCTEGIISRRGRSYVPGPFFYENQ